MNMSENNKTRRLIRISVILVLAAAILSLLIAVMSDPYPRLKTDSIKDFQKSMETKYPEFKGMTVSAGPLGYQIKVSFRSMEQGGEEAVQEIKAFIASEKFGKDAKAFYDTKYPDAKNSYAEEQEQVPKAALTVSIGGKKQEFFANYPYTEWTQH